MGNELLIGFGTDDGEHLNNDHVGMARDFHIYRFADGKKEEFVEQRSNSRFEGDESMKHGDPEKARATSSALEGVDVLVGKKFGPNITRLLKKFVCVVVKTDSLGTAIQTVHENMDRVNEEMARGEDRKTIVLRP
ncbi:MAG: NifB/NifX family molybdenum-iron cluster-binding protein [Dehalococcoidia bacterium]